MALTKGTITALDTSVWGQCINNTIADLQGLSLPEISDEVYFLKRPWHESLESLLPCCTVSWAPETSDPNEGPVSKNILHYRNMITMVWGANRDLLDNADKELLARQYVWTQYQKNNAAWSLTGGTLRQTSIISGEPYIREASLLNLDAQFLILDCEVCLA